MTRRLLLAVTALFCVSAFAQTSVTPILQPRQFFPNSVGAPCSGCSLYSYAAGTTTPQATYTDSSGNVSNPNPTTLDAAGSAQIWMANKSYKFVLKDALGNTIWTVDNVQPNAPYVTSTGGQVGATGYLPLGTISAKSSTCSAKGDGTTDDTAALQACISYAIAHNLNMYLPTPSVCYKVTGSLNATNTQDFFIIGDGPGRNISRSTICHALTEAFPVIDFTGCSWCGIKDLAIVPTGNNLSNSLATTGYLDASDAAHDGNNFHQIDSFIQAGNSATQAACVSWASDQFAIDQKSTCQGLGAGLIVGDAQGTATAVTSKFQTISFTSQADTYASISDSVVQGSLAPPLQLTGSNVYSCSGINSYAVIVGTTSVKKIIDVGETGTEGNTLIWTGCRTENQTGNPPSPPTDTGVTALYIGSAAPPHAAQINATLDTDSSGYSVGGPGALSFWQLTADGGGGAGYFNVTGGIHNSDIKLGRPSGLGSITGATYDVYFHVYSSTDALSLLNSLPAGSSGIKVCVQAGHEVNGFRCAQTGLSMAGGGTLLFSQSTGTDNIYSGYEGSTPGQDFITHIASSGQWKITNTGVQFYLRGPAETWGGGTGGFDVETGTYKLGLNNAGGFVWNGTTIPSTDAICQKSGTNCPGTITDIQITVGTSAITANSCTTTTTTAMSGVGSNSSFSISPASDISAVTGWSPSTTGQLYFVTWGTAGNFNYKVCNPTSSSITPGASTTWNIGAR